MNRLKGIKNIQDVKELLLLHKESIKKAALPVTVMAALLFFWIGDERDNKIEEINEPASGVVQEQQNEIDNKKMVADNSEIYVDISGCVYNPGVYKIKEGTRLFQVIEKAGGLTKDADVDSINQAEEVYDGQKIIIFTKDNLNSDINSDINTSHSNQNNGKININTADAVKLQEIPGIGPVTAQKIIDFREANGKFNSTDEIINVSGIGEKTYEDIKEYIIV